MPWGLPGLYLNSTSTTRQLGICTDFLIHLGNWTPVGLDQGYQQAPESGGGGVQRLLTCCAFSVRTLSLSGLQCSRSCWTLVPALSRIQRGKQRTTTGRRCPSGVGRGVNQLPAPPSGRHVTAGGGGGVGGEALVTSPPPPVRSAPPARLSLPALPRARPVSESRPAAPASRASPSLLRAGLSDCGSWRPQIF